MQELNVNDSKINELWICEWKVRVGKLMPWIALRKCADTEMLPILNLREAVITLGRDRTEDEELSFADKIELYSIANWSKLVQKIPENKGLGR